MQMDRIFHANFEKGITIATKKTETKVWRWINKASFLCQKENLS